MPLHLYARALDKQVTLEKESTTTNRVGTPKETYVFLKQCNANKVPTGGSTQYAEEGQVPFSTDTFIIRYDDRVDYKCRLIYNNNYYKIEHIEELGRKHWLNLKCIVWERANIQG